MSPSAARAREYGPRIRSAIGAGRAAIRSLPDGAAACTAVLRQDGRRERAINGVPCPLRARRAEPQQARMSERRGQASRTRLWKHRRVLTANKARAPSEARERLQVRTISARKREQRALERTARKQVSAPTVRRRLSVLIIRQRALARFARSRLRSARLHRSSALRRRRSAAPFPPWAAVSAGMRGVEMSAFQQEVSGGRDPADLAAASAQAGSVAAAYGVDDADPVQHVCGCFLKRKQQRRTGLPVRLYMRMTCLRSA